MQIIRLNSYNTHCSSLPHKITNETSEVCLFVKDVDRKKRDHQPTVDKYEELLNSKGVQGIAKVHISLYAHVVGERKLVCQLTKA